MSKQRVGWIGLGKLGLPCALAMSEHADVEIVGYDPAYEPGDILTSDEPGASELLNSADIVLTDSIDAVVRSASVIFVAVQTPHAPAYDGSEPMPYDRRDFDYTYLKSACVEVALAASRLPYGAEQITLVVISTVLPGTMDRVIKPVLGSGVRLVYNPFFIAMGSTIDDFLHPEFVLLGTDYGDGVSDVVDIYSAMHDAPIHVCSIPSAELIKVSYNTFISAKIVFANTLMEICQKTAADVDEVTDGLALATDRVISPKYLRGGMGDGGACHPRDLIAMSWLAEHLELSHDLFTDLARAREDQTEWLAGMVMEQLDIRGFDLIVILGRSYKAESSLTYGSPASLLGHYLDEKVSGTEVTLVQYDPYVDDKVDDLADEWRSAVYVIATDHPEFQTWKFAPGSVVIDPWRMVEPGPGYTVIHVGGV